MTDQVKVVHLSASVIGGLTIARANAHIYVVPDVHPMNIPMLMVLKQRCPRDIYNSNCVADLFLSLLLSLLLKNVY